MNTLRRVRSVPVVRTVCRQSRIVYDILSRLRQDAAFIEENATAPSCATLYFVSAVPLKRKSRRGLMKVSHRLLRIATPERLAQELGAENMPKAVCEALNCVAFAPLASDELDDPAVRRRLADAILESTRIADRMTRQDAARRSRKSFTRLMA